MSKIKFESHNITKEITDKVVIHKGVLDEILKHDDCDVALILGALINYQTNGTIPSAEVFDDELLSYTKDVILVEERFRELERQLTSLPL